MSDKELISKTYKELLWLNIKKTNSLLENGQRTWTLFQRRHTGGQQTQEKMLNVSLSPDTWVRCLWPSAISKASCVSCFHDKRGQKGDKRGHGDSENCRLLSVAMQASFPWGSSRYIHAMQKKDSGCEHPAYLASNAYSTTGQLRQSFLEWDSNTHHRNTADKATCSCRTKRTASGTAGLPTKHTVSTSHPQPGPLLSPSF